jgi:hypothetical protein|tara:strand:+ start:710 stop:1246 length:537 start_codon:yes stop_codon:yes gene_type:complete
MSNVIKIKRSETADSIPTTSDLAIGEICMNVTDQKLYTRKSDNSIVTISDVTTGKSSLELVSDDAGATAGPTLDLYRNSFSPFDSDDIGEIKFQGENDNSDKVVFAKITSKVTDASASTEDAILEFHVQEAGSSSTVIQIKGDGIHITSGNKITFADGTSMSTAPAASNSVTMAIALG